VSNLAADSQVCNNPDFMSKSSNKPLVTLYALFIYVANNCNKLSRLSHVTKWLLSDHTEMLCCRAHELATGHFSAQFYCRMYELSRSEHKVATICGYLISLAPLCLFFILLLAPLCGW